MDIKEIRISIGEHNLARVHDWTRAADQKAGFTLTITIAFLGVSLSMITTTVRIMREFILRGQGYWIFALFLVLAYVIYMYFGIRAVWFLMVVVKPRIIPTTKRKSPLFFGTIANMELQTFKEKMKTLDYGILVDEISDQTYVSSEIAVVKYKYLQSAFDSLFYAVVFGLISISATSIIGTIFLP